MTKFAFHSYGVNDEPDDDILYSRKEAERLRDHIKASGRYDASVERGRGRGTPEHRVVIKHKTQDLATYATRRDAANIKDPRHEPYWTFGKNPRGNS